ncbi:hypothetical protein [Microbacterium salsuginis]|uniref:hypothetical protein n=1 Tax=Microbacterium salsuginis TaxID=2722803 RepID=UPI001F100691|nr:hypothetical protein [Microbacterium sp. CFH 90308]
MTEDQLGLRRETRIPEHFRSIHIADGSAHGTRRRMWTRREHLLQSRHQIACEQRGIAQVVTCLRLVGRQTVTLERRCRDTEIVCGVGQAAKLHAHEAAVDADPGRGDVVVHQTVDRTRQPSLGLVEPASIVRDRAQLTQQDGLRAGSEIGHADHSCQKLLGLPWVPRPLKRQGTSADDPCSKIRIIGAGLGLRENALRQRILAVDAEVDRALV